MHRRILADAFGHAASVDCGYGLPDPETLFRSDMQHNRDDGRALLRVWCDPDHHNGLIGHLIARDNGEIVADQTFAIPQGVQHREVLLIGPVDRYELSLFDQAAGTLLHREEKSYFRKISWSMVTLGRTVQHNDKLSKDARAHWPPAQRLKKTSTGRSGYFAIYSRVCELGAA